MNDEEFIQQIKAFRADKLNGLQKMREFLKQPGHLDRLFDLAITGAGKPKKPPKIKARSQLPDGFPDQAQIDRAKGFWAMRKRRDLFNDAQHQADAFRDYHLGRGTLAADWNATWGTWMRNALTFSRQNPRETSDFAQAAETLEVWRWRVQTFHNGEEENGLPKGYWKDVWGPKPGETGCRAPRMN